MMAMGQVKLHVEHHTGAHFSSSEPLRSSLTASDRSIIFHGDDYSRTHIYKGDIMSPPRYNSLLPHFAHIHLILILT